MTHRGSSFQATLKWVPVSLENANGAPVTKYKLSRCTETTGCNDKSVIYEGMPFVETSSSVKFMKYDDGDIRPPNKYKYFLSAKNQATMNDGWGDESVYSVQPDPTRPDEVVNVRIDGIQDEGRRVPLHWDEPMFNNGADINLYQINVHEGAVCDDVDVVSIPTKTINLAQTEISKYCTPSATGAFCNACIK